MREFEHLIKQVFDFSLGIILLVLLSPLLLLIAIAIKLDSRGQAIFKQIRIGKNGKPFMFYKFRSMYENNNIDIHKNYIKKLMIHSAAAAHEEGVYKLTIDPRITRVGRFIRRTSIDELPQLFNVVKGDMSLVGPRPPIPYELEHYDENMFKRLSVKPGITGFWQVNARNSVDYKDMVNMDISYIGKWSLWLDVKILLKTIPVVIRSNKVY